MLSKVVCSLTGRAKSVFEIRGENKTRLISLFIFIALLTSCSSGGNQTQLISTPTSQPQLPDCESTDKGFCWPTGIDFSKDKVSPWLADSCGKNDNYVFKDRYHIGWDITTANVPDKVYAIADGEIFYIDEGSTWGTGNVGVFIKHTLSDGQEFLALYGHIQLNEGLLPQFKKGVRLLVQAGESFATIGPYQYGDHLHFGIVTSAKVPSTNKTLGIGWGMMPCPLPNDGNYNGFTDPLDWIKTKTPFRSNVLGATAVQEENLTPTAPIPVPGATPIRTISPTQMFSVGDYFIYDHFGWAVDRIEFIGTESVEGHNTWFFSSTRETSVDSTIKSFSYKYWVDQDTGIIVKAEYRSIYSAPQAWSIAGQLVDVIESTEYRVYDLKNNNMEGGNINIDTEGKQYEIAFPNPLGYLIFMITRNLQIGDWYPWEIANFSSQVIGEESVSVPAGTFDCWVVKEVPQGYQYVTQYFDKSTGILVKEELWSRNNGVSEKNGERALASFNWSALEAKQPQVSSNLPPLNNSDLSSVLRLLKYAIDNQDLKLVEPLIGNNGTTIAAYATEFDPVGYDNSDEIIPFLSSAFAQEQLMCLGYDQTPNTSPYKIEIYFEGNVDWGSPKANKDSRGIVLGLFKQEQKWELLWIGSLPDYALSYSHEYGCPTFNSDTVSSINLASLNREEYFSVLQWIKYAVLKNDISVFEDLIVGNSIQLIDGNNAAVNMTKSDFLAELSTRLTSKPNCEYFMFEESGRLVIRIGNWSPGWGVDGNTIVYLILEMRNNQWVLTSMVYGDHLPSWAQGLERISYDTISLSAGITTDAVCKEARPTRLKIGDFAFISFYPPKRQRIRSSYGTENPVLDTIALGTAIKILDGPKCADNWVWWKVRVLNSGLVGWTAEGDKDAYWLIPCESRDGCGTR